MRSANIPGMGDGNVASLVGSYWNKYATPKESLFLSFSLKRLLSTVVMAVYGGKQYLVI